MGRFLDHLEEWMIAFLIGAATLLIFVAVVHRYAAGMPIPVVQDWLLTIHLIVGAGACIYMFIWMAKFGAAYGVRTGIHVGVDVLINALPAPVRAQVRPLRAPRAARCSPLIVGTLGANYVWEIGHYRPDCPPTSNCRCGSSTCASPAARTSCASASCRSPGISRRPASCRSMTIRTWKASTRTSTPSGWPTTCIRPTRLREARDECLPAVLGVAAAGDGGGAAGAVLRRRPRADAAASSSCCCSG